jgi:hypothetical protein
MARESQWQLEVQWELGRREVNDLTGVIQPLGLLNSPQDLYKALIDLDFSFLQHNSSKSQRPPRFETDCDIHGCITSFGEVSFT